MMPERITEVGEGFKARTHSTWHKFALTKAVSMYVQLEPELVSARHDEDICPDKT